LLITVACILLLVLAGCSTTPESVGTENTGAQEADGKLTEEKKNQTSDTGNGRSEDTVRYPPGTDEQQITNVSMLYQQHYRVLLGSDYEARFEFTGDYYLRDAGQYSAVTQIWTIQSDLDDRDRLFAQTNTFGDGNISNRTWYDDGGVLYVQAGGQSADGTEHKPYYYVDRQWTEYGFDVHHTMFSRMMKYPVYNRFFTEHNPRHSDTIVQDGDTYHVYTVPKAGDDTSGRILVREDGFIKSIQINTTVDDHRATFSRTVTLRDDVSIDEPDWKQKAIQAEQRHNSGSGGGDTAADGCGTNDGDPDYNEDNDRDNDGLCDES
jgi:hypothetical protein